MEELGAIYTVLLFGLAFLILFISFYFGKKAGGYSEKSRYYAERKDLDKKDALIEAGNKELKREIDKLKHLNDRYLYFVMRIPETVKNLNSNLTFDEIISSIIRFTKDIINTRCIEIYLYNEAEGQLQLEAAYGSNRQKRITVKYGEGVIGRAARQNTLVSRDSRLAKSQHSDEHIFLGAPIMFRNRLIGVLGLGKLESLTGHEKRLIAMIADLAGVSLQNCERLSSAQRDANTDALTGLYNRKYLAERSLEEVQKAVSYNLPLSVFMFDIDHFKKYNDNNGHAEGDYLLRELSRLVKANTRGRDIIARYGGEEFIVLLPGTDKEGAYLYAEKIRKLIETAPFRHREKQPLGMVSVSGGVATVPVDGQTADSIIKAADSALYKSKGTRNRITSYEQASLTGE